MKKTNIIISGLAIGVSIVSVSAAMPYGTIAPERATGTEIMPRNMRELRGEIMQQRDEIARPTSTMHMMRPGTSIVPCDMPKMLSEYMISGGGMAMLLGASSTTSDLAYGDGNRNGKGAHVRALQAELIAGGYMTGTTTGHFGALTREAVKKYQKDLGIGKPTGYFGPQTKQKIKAKCMSMRNMNASSTIATSTMPTIQ